MQDKTKNAAPDGCDTGNGNGKQNVQGDKGPTIKKYNTAAGGCRARIKDLSYCGSDNGPTIGTLTAAGEPKGASGT